MKNQDNIDITYATVGEVMPYEAFNPTNGFVESSSIFDDDETTPVLQVKANDGNTYAVIPFGADNLLPYELSKKIGESSVMAQNKLFNVLTCYGMGLQYNDIKTKLPTKDEDINLFRMHNSMPRFALEQITDMKYYFSASQPSFSTKRAIPSWVCATKRLVTADLQRARMVAPNTCSMPTGATPSPLPTSRCCRCSMS